MRLTALEEEAVAAARAAVHTTPEGEEHRTERLEMLGRTLSDLYERTGDIALLDEAIEAQGLVVSGTAASASELAPRLQFLSYLLSALHAATSTPAVHAAALAAAQHALAALDPADPAWPGAAISVSNFLAREPDAWVAPGPLDEAVALARAAVAQSPAGRPEPWNTLSRRLGELYKRDHESDVLTEAVDAARSALSATPPGSIDTPRHQNTLAERLADLHDLTGDQRPVEEALPLALAASKDAPGRRGHIAFSTVAARVLGRSGRHGDARHVLDQALNVALTVLDYADGDSRRLRDLASASSGIPAELAYHCAMEGDAAAVVDTLERARPWLRSVERMRGRPTTSTPATQILYIAPARYGTVIASVDVGGAPSVHVSPVTGGDVMERLNIFRIYERGYDLALQGEGPLSFDVALRGHADAIHDLSSIAGQILFGCDVDERLLVVPVGTACLLPWAAARISAGVLAEHVTVSVAPTSGLVHGSTPHRGDGLAVLWGDGLDLTRDRRTLRELFGIEPLTDPTGPRVLALLRDHPAAILHVSSHGQYDRADPFESALHLASGTRICVRDVLDAPVQTTVVNLSACETGVPDHTRIDEFIGFPTAFLASGASHVFATLWSVSNDVATAYNRALYEGLTHGGDPAAAHRVALLRLRGRIGVEIDPTNAAADVLAPDDPYWWAAFTHYGSALWLA